MAHIDKYSRQELRRILKETYREYDDPTKYENDVDVTRSHLNYNMRKSIHGSYDFMNMLDDRVEDIINTEMDGKPPRNMPKFGSWVITCPRELTVEATGSDLPASVSKPVTIIHKKPQQHNNTRTARRGRL